MNYTIDASMFVATARDAEAHHRDCRDFIEQVQGHGTSIFCPALLLPESAAAIVRPTDNVALAEELVQLIESFPGLHLVAVDSILARRAVEIATTHRLRGSDAVYVATAVTFDATLITWDVEMLNRSRAVVSTLTPSEWTASQMTPAE